MDQMHNASPWLIQCDQTCQTSLDFSRSLVFNPMQRVSAAVFWSLNGSSQIQCVSPSIVFDAPTECASQPTSDLTLPTFNCDQTLHVAPHFVTLWTQIASRTAFESSLRLPVSIGAFVKTIANDGPNAQCQPLSLIHI